MKLVGTTVLLILGLSTIGLSWELDRHEFPYGLAVGSAFILLSLLLAVKPKKEAPIENEKADKQDGDASIFGESGSAATTQGSELKEASYVSELAKYYRDFLETSFHKRREPKRSIRYRHQKNYLLGFPTKKYEFFSNQIWTTILQGFPLTEDFTISRGKYVAKIPAQLQNLILKQVEALKTESITEITDQAMVAIYNGADAYKLRPLVAHDYAMAETTNLLRGSLVKPFLVTVAEALISQSPWDEDILEIVEDSLSEALLSPLREEIPELVNSVIADDGMNVQERFSGIFNLEFVKSTLITFFSDLAVNDLYLDMHELMRNEQLLDKQEMYLYFCDISFNKNKYPIFYIPIHLEKTRETITMMFDSSVFINKKAIDYIVQEFKKSREKAGSPDKVSDRILYLEGEREAFADKLQTILTDILDFFELPEEIRLNNSAQQIARGVGVKVSNACHICIFDKSDEAIINDYEEILETLKQPNHVTGSLFKSFVTGFIEEDPASVHEELEKEWDDLNTTSRLVYRSPIPLNEEQRKILVALKRKGCNLIAVQGPPGTGKSHTITAILCDAILRGDSVLVLSDKKEALDVVENKVTDVINSIRVGEDFQNPILRLGKAGSTYTKILSSAAMGAIEEHYRASRRKEDSRDKQILSIEAELDEHLKTLISGYAQVEIDALKDFCLLEQELKEKELLFVDVEEINERVNGIETLQNLKKQFDWFNLTLGNQGTFLNFEQVMSVLEVPRLTREAIDLFATYLSIAIDLNADILANDKRGKSLKALSIFRQFHTSQFTILEQKLRECDLLKNVFLARVRRKDEIKKLTQSFYRDFATNMRGSILDNYDTLNLGLDVFQRAMIMMRKPIHIIGAEAGLDYLRTIHWLLVERRTMFKHFDPTGVRKLFDAVDRFERDFPSTFLGLGISREEGESYFENKLVSLQEKDFKSLIRYLSLHSEYKRLFENLPKLDFLGKKQRLESLVTETMAHGMDGRVVKFYHDTKATAQTIRTIIRKKQKFPREDFQKLRNAFPCIIAGIRDFSDYIPLEVGLFDVVIIDEASQVSVAQALPAIVRGKKVVVLGDTKQFSNLQSSLAKSEINQEYLKRLVETFKGARGDKISQLERLKKLDIRTSILELFEYICNFQITLLKHARGYREHISYSSKYFYNGRLQALKIRIKRIDDALKFTLVEHDDRVEKFKNTNQLEINAIKAELKTLKDSGEGGTIGIITPFHDQQTRLSDEINKMPDRDYFFEKRKLKIMTFDTCQGEERDTVLYSMVATRSEDKLIYIFPRDLSLSFYEDEGKIKVQRLNVGFSRAKECMHFFHSKPLEEFKGAIGGALLHFWNALEEGRRLPEAKDTDPTSPMEPKVLEWIKSTEFVRKNIPFINLEAQFPIGEYLKQLDRTYNHPKYRTDFLLWYKHPDSQEYKIIIEYDGFHHFIRDHGRDEWTEQVYYSDRDLEREKTLESYGYKFLRLNRFNVGKDPVKTLDQRFLELVVPLPIERKKDSSMDQRKPQTAEAPKKTSHKTEPLGQGPISDPQAWVQISKWARENGKLTEKNIRRSREIGQKLAGNDSFTKEQIQIAKDLWKAVQSQGFRLR